MEGRGERLLTGSEASRFPNNPTSFLHCSCYLFSLQDSSNNSCMHYCDTLTYHSSHRKPFKTDTEGAGQVWVSTLWRCLSNKVTNNMNSASSGRREMCATCILRSTLYYQGIYKDRVKLTTFPLRSTSMAIAMASSPVRTSFTSGLLTGFTWSIYPRRAKKKLTQLAIPLTPSIALC